MNSKPETPQLETAIRNPRIVAWEITRRCELKCRHCRGAARDCDYAGEFTTDECFQTIDALAAFSKPMIILTGGEPLVRDDIFPVARYAAEKGCRTVLATCGHLLTEEVAAKLKNAGVMGVSISLDAATPEAHDLFRGISGACQKSIAGIGLLKRAGIPFQINTTVSKINVEDLPLILNKAILLGASTMDFFFLVPTGRGSEIADLALEPDDRDRALEWIAAQSQTAPIQVRVTCAPQYKKFLAADLCPSAADLSRNAPFRGCMGGRGFVFISHTGVLQPCGFLDLPCGNLRDADFDFETLYRESEVFNNIRTLNPFAGCPARAYARSGNYMKDEDNAGQAGSLSCIDMNCSGLETKILTQLQRGIEITARPFQGLENLDAVSSPRFQCLEILKKAQADRLVRRFGGIFDSRRLGYKSILCALEASPEELEEKAAIVSAHPGVTHCYERSLRDGTYGMYPSLWFTFAALHTEFDSELKSLNSELRTPNSELFQLPALHRFKIEVVFDLDASGSHSPAPVEGVVPEVLPTEFSEAEKELVRAIDQQIPLIERPFAAVAEQIGQSEEWVLSTLRRWKERGMLRRIGAVLYHREAGLKDNAMCVWPVVEDDILRAGRAVASRPEVTHCYQRPRLDVFPFDLYAMIHTGSRKETEALFEDISKSCGLSGGELFASGREFKKSSMHYFRQGSGAATKPQADGMTLP